MPLLPVVESDEDPLGSIATQVILGTQLLRLFNCYKILLDRLIQPILHIDSYQTENRMIYGNYIFSINSNNSCKSGR